MTPVLGVSPSIVNSLTPKWGSQNDTNFGVRKPSKKRTENQPSTAEKLAGQRLVNSSAARLGACDLVSLPSHGWGPHSGVSEETVCYLWALTVSASFFDPSFGPAKSAPFCLARCPDVPDHASDDQERKPGYTEEQDVPQTRRKRFTKKPNYHMFRRRSFELSCKLRNRIE